MKKRIMIVAILIILSLSAISILSEVKKKQNEDNNVLEPGIAIMVQNATNTTQYDKWSSEKWPNSYQYKLNTNLSICDDKSIQNVLEYNNNLVSLDLTKSRNCKLFFDQNPTLFKDLIISQAGSQNVGDNSIDLYYIKNKAYKGQLLKHSSNLNYSAKDDGYRYSGDNPKNFVCFGKGAEEYTAGGETCPIDNLFRIIGVVPVDIKKSNGNMEKQTLIKLIQSQYATIEQLGFPTFAYESYNYGGLYGPHVQFADYDYYFHWGENYDWSTSYLFEALNKAYLDDTIGAKWKDKIENVEWNIGGGTDSELYSAIPKTAIDAEIKNGINNHVEAKIGLMYVHDYGFASDNSNWNKYMKDYGDSSNTDNNWLYNGVREWTISKSLGYDEDDVFEIYRGYTASFSSKYSDYTSIRPTFYLKANVAFLGGSGSAANPYKISLD